jgi:hypothetical protein
MVYLCDEVNKTIAITYHCDLCVCILQINYCVYIPTLMGANLIFVQAYVYMDSRGILHQMFGHVQNNYT